MPAPAIGLERAIPVVLIAQTLCLPCLVGMVIGMPFVGVVTLASFLLAFVLLGLTAGLDVRLGASVWAALALGAVAIGALLWACTVADLPKTLGLPLVGSLALSTVLLTAIHCRRRRLPDVHCPVCGYDLRGTTANACPECGARGRREMA